MSLAPLKLEIFRLFKNYGLLAALFFVILMVKGAIFLAAKWGAFGEGMDNGFVFFSMSGTHSLFLISFLLLIVSASTLSGEYSAGLLRMVLTRPLSRSSYYLSKSLFFILLILMLLILDVLCGLLFGFLGFEFKDAADPALQGPQFGAASMAVTAIRAYLLSFLALSAITSLGLFISTLFRSAVIAICAAAGLFFLMEGVRILFLEPTSTYVLTLYANEHIRFLSMISRGIAQPPVFFTKAVGIPLAYFLLANILGLLVFKKKDVLD